MHDDTSSTPRLTPEQRAHRAAAAAHDRVHTGDVAPMVHGRTMQEGYDALLALTAREGRLRPHSEPTTNGTDDDERRTRR